MYITSTNSTTYSGDHFCVYQVCKVLSQGAMYAHIVRGPPEDVHLHLLV